MRTLDSLVKDYIGQSGRVTLHKYQQYMNYATAILRSLHFDIDGVNKVQQLVLEDSCLSYLPNDLIRLVRVYMAGSNGRIIPMSEDKNLNPRSYDDCGNDVTIGTNGSSIGSYQTAESVTEHVNDGQIIGREYGQGGGTVYLYRYNRERGRLEFSSNVNPPIFIEYLGSPERWDGKLYVNEEAENAILTGIRYYELRFKNRIPAIEKQMAKDDWFNAKHHYNIRVKSPSLFEAKNAKRKSFKQSPKY